MNPEQRLLEVIEDLAIEVFVFLVGALARILGP
jgi:hypothetical protein